MAVTFQEEQDFVKAFREGLKELVATAHLRVSVIPMSGWWEVGTHEKNSPRTLYATRDEAVEAGRRLAKTLKGYLTLHQENIRDMVTEDYSQISS